MDTSSGVSLNGETPYRWENRLRLLATPAVAGYWLLIFVTTHIPNPENLPTPDVSDKLLHFSAYFVLYGLFSVRHRLLTSDWPDGKRHGQFLLLLTIYAVLDELLQLLPVVNRNADLLDGIADCGGLLTAAFIVMLIQFQLERGQKNGNSE